MNINEYRAQFAAYNSALELARYRRHVGSEPEYGIDQVRADHADLFSASALADLNLISTNYRQKPKAPECADFCKQRSLNMLRIRSTRRAENSHIANHRCV